MAQGSPQPVRQLGGTSPCAGGEEGEVVGARECNVLHRPEFKSHPTVRQTLTLTPSTLGDQGLVPAPHYFLTWGSAVTSLNGCNDGTVWFRGQCPPPLLPPAPGSRLSSGVLEARIPWPSVRTTSADTPPFLHIQASWQFGTPLGKGFHPDLAAHLPPQPGFGGPTFPGGSGEQGIAGPT